MRFLESIGKEPKMAAVLVKLYQTIIRVMFWKLLKKSEEKTTKRKTKYQ